MDINIIRLRSKVNAGNNLVKIQSDEFIDNLNLLLTDFDLLLKEGTNSPFNLILVESGGVEQTFLKLLKEGSIRPPYYLLPTQMNNSLAASFEINTYCNDNNIPSMVILGGDEQIIYFLSHVSKAYEVFERIKGQNVGLIGGISSWLISSKVEPKMIEEFFNMHLIKISRKELEEEIDKKQIEDEYLLKNFEGKFDHETLLGAFYIYGALKRICLKHDLACFSIKCFDLLGKYKNTACLALSLLNDQGITAGCEGDIPSLLTMHILSMFSGYPCFMANPSKFDFFNRYITFAHCTVPLKLCSNFALDTHFESDLGIGISGEMRESKVTVCKFMPNFKNVIANVGDIVEVPHFPNMCRTQIKVEFDEIAMKEFSDANFGNHLIITYGDHIPEILSIFDILTQNYLFNKLSK